MPLIDRLKEHWLISTFLICAAVAGGTWKLAWEMLVVPRDFQIAQLEKDIVKTRSAVSITPLKTEAEKNLLLPETGVLEGAAVTTTDGRCVVAVKAVSEDAITLTIQVRISQAIEFKNQKVGHRATVDAGDRYYIVDLHRVRGKIVDLSVYQDIKEK